MKIKKFVYIICTIIPIIFGQIHAAEIDTIENNYSELLEENTKIRQIIEMVNESIIKDFRNIPNFRSSNLFRFIKSIFNKIDKLWGRR